MLSHLIVVACHAVYIAPDYTDPLRDEAWWLQPFQAGEPPYYLDHIRGGVELAAGDNRACLLFSGGQTRRAAGPRSEAQSYWLLADHFGWWSHPSVRERASTEEFARDSFEHLLFGICRFHEWVGTYPERMTVVGWHFKAERFDLHRAALRFPVERFRYVGINDPTDVATARDGEYRNSIRPYRNDPYGTGVELAAKRDTRNPFRRANGYAASCPELRELLAHRGPEVFSGSLPWTE